MIKQHCIFGDIQTNYYRNKSTQIEILIKFVLMEYNSDFKDWDINYIKQDEKVYDKVLRGIQS